MTTQTLVEIGTAGGSSIIGPLITAFATIIAATTVGVFSWRQWRVAKDKLALDLFDRRLAAWETMRSAINNAFNETYAVWTAGPGGPAANDSFDKSSIKAAWNQARWLFGPEVLLKFAFVESGFAQFRAKLFADWEQDMSMGQRITRYQIGEQRLMSAYTDLQDAVGPYMMLGDIAVNRPAKRWKLKWPFKRPKK